MSIAPKDGLELSSDVASYRHTPYLLHYGGPRGGLELLLGGGLALSRGEEALAVSSDLYSDIEIQSSRNRVCSVYISGFL